MSAFPTHCRGCFDETIEMTLQKLQRNNKGTHSQWDFCRGVGKSQKALRPKFETNQFDQKADFPVSLLTAQSAPIWDNTGEAQG